MADPMNTYRITIEMDTNGWWFVNALDVPGAHSHGQTLAAARRNIREAIVLMGDLPAGAEDTFELAEWIQFPAAVSAVLEAVGHARAEHEAATVRLRETTDEALKTLTKEYPDLGLRDLAELLGLSYQRVAQLLPGRPRSGRKAAPSR
jgi:hypothetical protein